MRVRRSFMRFAIGATSNINRVSPAGSKQSELLYKNYWQSKTPVRHQGGLIKQARGNGQVAGDSCCPYIRLHPVGTLLVYLCYPVPGYPARH